MNLSVPKMNSNDSEREREKEIERMNWAMKQGHRSGQEKELNKK